MVFELDDAINEDILDSIRNIKNVENCVFIESIK